METKDYFSLALSAVSLVVAGLSLAVSMRQRAIESKRSTRKELTDVIAELAEVDLAFNKLRIEHPSSVDENVVAFRRTYNAQRRFLAYHGEFLMQGIDELVNDVDCQALARAFESSGYDERAELLYEKAVRIAPNPTLRAMNLRGLARHWFSRGNAAKGRSIFDEAASQDIGDTDRARRTTAETYLWWARTEEEFGFEAESGIARQRALVSAERIGHRGMREEMIGQIRGEP